MKNKIILFIFVFLFWALLRYPLDLQHALIGLLVAFVVAALVGHLFTARHKLFLEPKRYIWFVGYIFIFALECLKANIDMALRLILPNIPLAPGIIKLKTNLKNDISLMYLANTLTLTKNAISIDIDKENGFIYIHWIDLKTTPKEKIIKSVQTFEKILGKIFE